MNYFDAMRLLDQVRDGRPHPLHSINQALELTGDGFGVYEGLRGAGMETASPAEGQRPGQTEGAGLVESSDRRH